MHRRHLLLAAPSALFLASAALGDDSPAKAPLSLAIAIGKRSGAKRQLEFRDNHSHFAVVLRNESDTPLRVWREWCSWGYFNLSFTMTADDGQRHAIVKAPQEWGKNYPDFEEFGPGESIVRDVYLRSDAWQGVPRDPKVDGREFKLQAAYHIAADDDSAKAMVWTGKIESPVIDVQIFGL